MQTPMDKSTRSALQFSPSDMVDLANYLYDRQQSTPLEDRHVNSFLDWITDWLKESKEQRVKRNNAYLAAPEKREPEYHAQLVKLAKSLKLFGE